MEYMAEHIVRTLDNHSLVSIYELNIFIRTVKVTNLACVGDMLVKKTLVFLRSILFFTHLNMLFIPILYASSVETSVITFSSSSNDPCLYIHTQTNIRSHSNMIYIHIIKWAIVLLKMVTVSSSSSQSSTIDKCWRRLYQRFSNDDRVCWLTLSSQPYLIFYGQ